MGCLGYIFSVIKYIVIEAKKGSSFLWRFSVLYTTPFFKYLESDNILLSFWF